MVLPKEKQVTARVDKELDVVVALDNLELVLLGQKVINIFDNIRVSVKDGVSDAFLHGRLELGHPRNILFLLEFFKHFLKTRCFSN